ncbi:Ankyrin repeat domain-containing protein 50 [Colletotrichum siamense]|nr:Ankyrin repeat domain-containing protein 50 [Colletotrichum siamense]
MPEKADNSFAKSAQIIVQEATDQAFNEHIQLILYCLSNNMYNINYDDDSSWLMAVTLIERSGLTSQTLDLAQEKDLTVTSIAENLFELCIEFRHARIHRSRTHASNSNIISWLLKSGQNPDVEVNIGDNLWLPLQLATRDLNLKLVVELLDAGADPNRCSKDHESPLLLLLRDVRVDSYLKMTPAQREVFGSLVLRFLEAGASLNERPSDKGPSALMWAVRLDLQIADLLIQYDAKVEHRVTIHDNDIAGSEFIRTQSVMGFAMYNSNEEQAMRKVQHLVGHVQRSGSSIPVADLLMADVVCLAAYFGFNEVIEYCCSFQNNTDTRQRILFSALCAASSRGCRKTCELLLQYGAPIKGPERLEAIPLPLHFAALADHSAVIKLLCEHGADVNAKFKGSGGNDHARNYMWNRSLIHRRHDKRIMFAEHCFEINPLGAAIIGTWQQTSQSFETLIQYGAELPIWAVYYGASRPQSPGIVYSAVDQGGNLNWRGPDGRTPLQRALQPLTMTRRASFSWKNGAVDKNDCLGIINSLVNAGAETAGSEAELIVFLKHWSHSDEVSMGPFHGDSRLKTYNLSTLAAVFLTRSIPRIEWTLAKFRGAYDPGALCAGVMLAIQSGCTEPLQQLIINRPDTANVSEQEGTALGLAAWYGQVYILDMLLSKIQNLTPALVPIDLYGFTTNLSMPSDRVLDAYISESFEEDFPFWHGKPELNYDLILCSPLVFSLWSEKCLDKLLENDFKPDRLTLSVAVCYGKVEILEKLLQGKWDIGSDIDRPGPLYFSVAQRLDEMTRVLLNAGLSPNEDNELVSIGRSPLQQAVEDGNLEMIDLLLEFHADVNARAARFSGATALQLAAIKGRLGIARRLIDLGANVNASGAERNGRTALEGAAEHGRLDMVQLLLDCGANVAGDGCLQYFKAIRFAETGAHKVVANLLKKHREWTSFDHEMWELFFALDKERLEELESLEELIDSSASSERIEIPLSSDRDGDSPGEGTRLDDYSDYGHNSIRRVPFAEGRISPTEAAPRDGSLGQLEDLSNAVLDGIDFDNMVAEDHIASRIHDDTAWNQRFGHAENEVQTLWNFGPIEAVYGVHTMQGFQITDFDSQSGLNHQLPAANQDLQALWGTVPIGVVDYEMKMEEQLFPGMMVDSAWNQHFGTTDWNGPQYSLGTEIESRVCYEILEGDMGWVGTQDHHSQSC